MKAHIDELKINLVPEDPADCEKLKKLEGHLHEKSLTIEGGTLIINIEQLATYGHLTRNRQPEGELNAG